MTTRTASANELTEVDRRTLEICKKISQKIKGLIRDPDDQKEFHEVYGKVSFTRDAGSGRGGGKLQRDALCTRGKTDKSPVSNRNLRWHPLVVSNTTPNWAKEVLEVVPVNSESPKRLELLVDGGGEGPYRVKAVDFHNLTETVCATSEKWQAKEVEFSEWKDADWHANRSVIPALEYCTKRDAVETYFCLAVAIAEGFGVDNSAHWPDLLEILVEGLLTLGYSELSPTFPSGPEEISRCPLCKSKIHEPWKNFRAGSRELLFSISSKNSKRSEGEDDSLQVMHTLPLIESEIRHNSGNVRFGHRWCNVSMTDHSVEETRAFFAHVLENSKRED